MIEDNPEDIKSLLELTRIYVDNGEFDKVKDLLKQVDQRLQKKQKALSGASRDNTLTNV